LKKLLGILFLLIPLLTWANTEQMDGLHCGDVVTITATPDKGYRFVSWSDGNTDNPREIEITEAVELTAIYEKMCVSEEVPVLWLYDQLLMVNVDSLQQMGYVFSEQSVEWYRIVGDIDAESTTTNDELLGTGYYYVVQPKDIGYLYAAVDVSQTPSGEVQLCTYTLYSRAIRVGQTDLGVIREDDDVVQKVIIDNQLYIICGDRVYRADGSQIK